MEITDFSPAIAILGTQFNRTGMSWDHPRVKAWMDRAGFPTRYHASLEAYYTLAEHLEKLPSIGSEEQKGAHHAAA